MKHLVKVLMLIFALVFVRAAYGFFFAFVAWDLDGSIGVALRARYDPAIAHNLESSSAYLISSNRRVRPLLQTLSPRIWATNLLSFRDSYLFGASRPSFNRLISSG
jgi:hypothetical protein